MTTEITIQDLDEYATAMAQAGEDELESFCADIQSLLSSRGISISASPLAPGSLDDLAAIDAEAPAPELLSF